jgi:tripartite-type tricarboxylate transporter receptor subunit TctC
MRWTICVLGAAVVIAVPGLAGAQSPAEFYKNREIKLMIGSAPGGGYDTYARMAGKHMVRVIPGGTARILPVNMPGGAGIRVVNWVDNVGDKDGSVMVIPRRGLPMYQVMGGKAVTADLAKMNWICDLSDAPPVLVTWAASPVKTLEDAKKQKTTVGGSGGDSITAQLSTAYNRLLGTQFEAVVGYQGGGEINLAMERGEIYGRATNNMASWKAIKPDWVAEGKLKYLILLGLKRDPDIPDTPLLIELVKDDPEKLEVARFLTLGNTIGRPLAVHSAVPKDRVEALRTACEKTLVDAEFLADAEKQRAEFSFRSGEDVQSILVELANTPAPTIEKVKHYMDYKEEESK